MNATVNPIRIAPARTLQKWKVWKCWSSTWNGTYIAVGGASTALATIVAANTKAHFFDPPYDVILAAGAAMFTFLVNALGAQAKGSAFETAARELEKAITGYETNAAVTEVQLGEAEQRGIDILNRLKAH
jgi:hypothetical protein